jgi:hypothetical protein
MVGKLVIWEKKVRSDEVRDGKLSLHNHSNGPRHAEIENHQMLNCLYNEMTVEFCTVI